MRRTRRRRESGQVLVLTVIITFVMVLVGGGLIDVAGAIQYDDFLLRVAASGAMTAATQTIEDTQGVMSVDQPAATSLGNAMLQPWLHVHGVTAVSLTTSGTSATAVVQGLYRPPILGYLPGFGGFALQASRTQVAVPTG